MMLLASIGLADGSIEVEQGNLRIETTRGLYEQSGRPCVQPVLVADFQFDPCH